MGCFDPTKTESRSTTETKTEGQKTGLQKALDLFLPELDKGPDIFGGKRVAPFSALQEGAIGGAQNFMPTFSTPQTAGMPLFGETQTALKGALEGTTGATPFTSADTESFFNRAVRDPTLKGFRENVIPGIEESFSGPGFFGAARSQELSKANKDVNQQLGASRAALEFDVLGRNQQLEEARAGRSLTAIPQAQQFSRLPAQNIQDNLNIAAQQLGGLGSLFGIGQAQQTQEQAELQNEIAKFAEANRLVDPEDLSIIMALLGLNFSQSSSHGTRSGAKLGYVGASAALSGYGGALGGGMATPKVPTA